MRVFLLLFIMTITACVSEPPKPRISIEQVKKNVDLSTLELKDCVMRHISNIDDRKSDALTIAIALASICDREYRSLIRVGSQGLDNFDQVHMFRQHAFTQERKIAIFLPIVLQNRGKK